MKILIWFLCILVYAVITVLFMNSGIILGAIPTVILLGGAMWLAKALCKKWDEQKGKKKEN